MSEAILQINRLTKVFKLSKKQKRERGIGEEDFFKAIDNVSFELKKGRIYGLLGPNGAGKTTTLRMVATLLTATEGEILFEGQNIYQDINAYRKKVGFLTSELKLDDFFTPSYTYDFFSKLYGIPDEVSSCRKEELFNRFGIEKFANSQIKNLSTGMKQKVSLAISIAHDPDIIIFDEPTNGLDILAARDVENFLIELRKQGKAVVLSSHIFSLVEKLCDEVGIIVKGKMLIQGDMKDVCKDKTLEERFFSLIEEDQ